MRRRRVAGPAWSDARVGREVPGTARGTQGPRTHTRRRHQVLVPLAGAVPACGMCRGPRQPRPRVPARGTRLVRPAAAFEPQRVVVKVTGVGF